MPRLAKRTDLTLAGLSLAEVFKPHGWTEKEWQAGERLALREDFIICEGRKPKSFREVERWARKVDRLCRIQKFLDNKAKYQGKYIIPRKPREPFQSDLFNDS